VSTEDRFFAFVDPDGPLAAIRPDLGRCWLWTGGLGSSGYPEFWRDGQVVTGRRAAWEIAWGEHAPAGLRFEAFACHLRLCVNPAHIGPIVVPDGPSGRWLARFYAARMGEPGARCVEGHLLDPPRGVVEVPGGFACRQCRRDAERARRRRLTVSAG
jgi:hypothetical protein